MIPAGEVDPHLDAAVEAAVLGIREDAARRHLAVLVWEPRPLPRKERP